MLIFTSTNRTIMSKSKKIQCPRCGGSGKVEHTHVVYGVCFMCNGDGMVYSNRAEELTSRAKARKANKAAKEHEDYLEAKALQDAKWERIHTEITKRNVQYFNEYRCATNDAAKAFYKQIKGMSSFLGLNEKSSEAEVRKMFDDYFKSQQLHYRLEISKYTQKHHGFIFIDLCGKNTDLTNCQHEVQILIEKTNNF